MLLAEEIRKVNSLEDVVIVSRKILKKSNIDDTLKLDFVKYLEGKAKKCLSKRIEGWLICFKLRIPEGTIMDPDLLFVELYPTLGEFYIPDIF